MDNESRLEVFEAQTLNVRELAKARKQITRTINEALRKDNTALAKAQTKILVLVYSAWYEALLSKLIHTPYGFDLDEIQKIKDRKRSGISKGWEKCVELGLMRVASSPSSKMSNIQEKLLRFLDEYVFAPSQVRNRIAHGQVLVALNSRNSAVNQELTEEINNLDVVKVTKWFNVQKQLAEIIEALIESPNHAFHRDYGEMIDKLETYLEETKNYRLEDKILKLKRKPKEIKSK